MLNLGKKNVLGVGVSVLDYDYAVAEVVACAKAGRRCTVSALAVHGVMTGALDPAHQWRLNHLDLVTPDGQPVRWALNLLHHAGLKDRVYGPELTPRVCEAAAREGLGLYFYGSTPETLERLGANLARRFPGIRLSGMEPSKFRKLDAAEQRGLAGRIRDSGARIVFAGLGCPRQEVFAYEMGKLLDLPILAVGAAFDYHAGLLTDPPRLVQRLGLQWLHRLVQEPRRLWRRYLVTNTQFVVLFFAQWARLWKPDMAGAEPGEDLRYG